jgi:DNA polymerase II small subunit/DNA polymerase delta subunit B
MENLRKKNETEIQNTMEGCSSRLEQVEDRISEVEDKMEIKGKKIRATDNSTSVKEICKNSPTPSKTEAEIHGH